MERALLDVAAGRSRTLIVTGPAGMGKSTLLAATAARAREQGFRVGTGTSAAVEGAWPYAAVVEVLADLCRRHPTLLDGLPDHHREEIDRVLAGAETAWSGASSHQHLFVAAAELVRLASATQRPAARHRRRPRRRRRQPAPHPLHRPLHPRPAGLHRARLPAGAEGRDLGRDQPEPARPPGCRGPRARRRSATTTSAALIRRHLPEPGAGGGRAHHRAGPRHPLRRAGAGPAGRPRARAGCRASTRRWSAALPPVTREVLQRVAVVGATFDTDEFVALSGHARGRGVRPPRRRARRPRRRAGQRRLPLPPRPRP